LLQREAESIGDAKIWMVAKVLQIILTFTFKRVIFLEIFNINIFGY
jgi:hypothetical protein